MKKITKKEFRAIICAHYTQFGGRGQIMATTMDDIVAKVVKLIDEKGESVESGESRFIVTEQSKDVQFSGGSWLNFGADQYFKYGCYVFGIEAIEGEAKYLVIIYKVGDFIADIEGERRKYWNCYDEQRGAENKERAEQEAKEVARREALHVEMMEGVIKELKEGREVKNKEITTPKGTEKSLFLALFDYLGIKIPTRTKDWVNNALYSIWTDSEGDLTYRYCNVYKKRGANGYGCKEVKTKQSPIFTDIFLTVFVPKMELSKI